MAYHLEAGITHEVIQIRSAAGKEIVDTKHVVTVVQEALAQMRTDKSGAASDQYLFAQHAHYPLLCHRRN